MKTNIKDMAKKYGWIAGGAVLVLSVAIGLGIANNNHPDSGIEIHDDAAPRADEMQFSAVFYISMEPISGEIQVDRLLRVGEGIIKVTATGRREFSAEGVEVIQAPDVSGYVDDDHKVAWTHMYGIGDVRTVVGEVVELTEEEKAEREASKVYTVPNVEEMLRINAKANQKIVTEGYYAKNDGGGANYLVTTRAESDLTSVLLDNGLYATLVTDGQLNVRQVGAHGDGDHDDFAVIDRALNSSFETIYIPAGTYAMNGKTVSLSVKKNVVGDGKDHTTLTNAGIKTTAGIRLEGLSFFGGSSQKIRYTGLGSSFENVIINASPVGKQSVEYQSCAFSNATIASFAREEKGSFASDVINDCSFRNIGRVAVYHSLPSDSTYFTGNTVSNIGSSDLKTGAVAALWIGDVTNITCVQSANVHVIGNTIENLITADDFSGQDHIMNANFLAIRADTAVIDNNKIHNLIGYGNDREGVYTKVRDLTITNNEIINGGMGEGYICNKSQEGNAFCRIEGNTLVGSGGCGIRTYVAGTISGNTIDIDNCTSCITCTRRSGLTNEVPLQVTRNYIYSGTYSEYNAGAQVISSYSTGKAIRLSGITVPVEVSGNEFYTKTSFNHYISIGNPGNEVSTCGNKIYGADKDGTGIFIFSNKNGSDASLNCKVDISYNEFYMSNSAKATRVNFENGSSTSTGRKVTFVGNMFEYTQTDKSGTVLICDSGAGNSDELVASGNECNLEQKRTYVTYSVGTVSDESSDFATYKKK